jgi:biopolymer transport protein ExbD
MKLKNSYRIVSIIPVASMSDIAFLLLIFMLLSSLLTPQPPLQVAPPQVPNTAEVKEEKGTRIYLDASGHIAVNEELGRLEDIAALLARLSVPKDQIYLYADAECAFEKIDEVLAASR